MPLLFPPRKPPIPPMPLPPAPTPLSANPKPVSPFDRGMIRPGHD